MSSVIPYKQELPPQGGYKKLDFRYVPPKKFMTGARWFAFTVIQTFGWMYWFKIEEKGFHEREVEDRSAYIAMEPMLRAERERELLRQIRKNRDEERELMKNYEGWEVGKFKNEPIFKSLKEDEWIDQTMNEYYGQTHERNMTNYLWYRHWH